MQNKVVKKEKKEGLSHLKARKFFEFVFVEVNALEHAVVLFVFVCVVVENAAGLFVLVALFVFGSASYLVHVAERPRSSRGRSAKRIRS